MRNFALNLASARKSAGLSMADLAARTGLSRQAIHLLETGQRQPRLDTAEKLLAACRKRKPRKRT